MLFFGDLPVERTLVGAHPPARPYLFTSNAVAPRRASLAGSSSWILGGKRLAALRQGGDTQAAVLADGNVYTVSAHIETATAALPPSEISMRGVMFKAAAVQPSSAARSASVGRSPCGRM